VAGVQRGAVVLAVAASIVTACIGGGAASAPPGSVAGSPGPAPAGSGASPGLTGPPGATPGATTPGAQATLPASATWARLEVDGRGPAAREDHTWTVADDGVTAYLFGGREGGTAFDDLWAFDLATNAWRRVAFGGDAPAARFGHEAAWVPGRGLVVFAGQAGSTFFDDLWLFDPGTAAWQRLPAGGLAPVARYGSCSGVAPDGRLWISHGFTEDGARFADTRAYDFGTGAWSDQAPAGPGPVERCLHACWFTSDGRLALYGGQTTGVPALGDLWYLTPGASGAPTNSWTEAASPAPEARQLAAVARRGSLTIVVGGRSKNGRPLADGWLLLDGAAGFSPLETGGSRPPARSGGAMVYDAANDRVLLFGGIGADALDDLWELTFA
jgi:hypothetical protein